MAVRLEHVSKSFPLRSGPVRAVDDLTLDVADGELLVLVGPSGCGKTTTLRLIAGLETPSAGAVSIGGRVVNDLPPRERDVGMVFQHHALYPHMRVSENLAFGLKMRGAGRAEIEERVHRAAVRLGIEHLLMRRPASLSGGECQRVALGRAVVRRPRVFLLDEPLSDLDARLRDQMRSEIKTLQRDLGVSMIYVTHDQAEAMTLGDRIAVMDGGVLQQCGAPMAVYAEPANRVVAGFIGSPAMNFLAGRVEADGRRVAFSGPVPGVELTPAQAERAGQQAGRGITVGIRPEDLRLNAPVVGGTGREKDVVLGTGQVRLVEPMGHCVCVHVGIGQRDGLVVRADAGAALRPGEAVEVAVDRARLHLFAADAGGRRIG